MLVNYFEINAMEPHQNKHPKNTSTPNYLSVGFDVMMMQIQVCLFHVCNSVFSVHLVANISTLLTSGIANSFKPYHSSLSTVNIRHTCFLN